MKKLLRLTKLLLNAALFGVGQSVWATDFLTDELTFEDAEAYANGWTLTNTPGLSRVQNSTNYYLMIGADSDKNVDAATYTFSSAVQTADSWKLEFDWNAYGSSNNNSSYLDVRTSSGTKFFRIIYKQTGNATLQDASGNSLGTLPIVDYSTSTRGSNTRAVPAYHFTLTADATNGIYVTVTNISTSETVIASTQVSSSFSNLVDLFAYVYYWYAAISLDNVKAYAVSDIDVVPAPTVSYTQHGNKPVVTGSTASGSTFKTYYSTSETATPASTGTLWTNNSTTLPAAGTYYFYNVSDYSAGGTSAATTYSYIDGIYENYNFEAWINDDGEVSFTSDASNFKGHNLFDRIGFSGSWKVTSGGIQGTAQGNEIHVKNLAIGDKVIFTFTGGYVRTYSSGTNFGISEMNDLTSGTVYTCTTAGTQKLWDRKKSEWAIFARVQVVTPTYTLFAPTITYDAGNASTSVTITPGLVRNTESTVYGTLYITTDGSDPTDANNAARVTELTTLTQSATVKAATYYEGVYSEVTEQYVPVAEKMEVATVTFNGLVLDNGNYYKQFTLSSDQSSHGSPEVVYAYEYSTDDFASIVSSGNVDGTTFLATTAGKVRFYATSTGYINSDASDVFVTNEYKQTATYDFVNNDDIVVSLSDSHSTYKALPGFSVVFGDRGSSVDNLERDNDGLFFNTVSSATYTISNAFDGQMMSYTSKTSSTGNYTTVWVQANNFSYSRYKDAGHYGHIGAITIYTPTSLLATDISDAATIDLTGIVLYAGNISTIAAATSATTATTINVGQIAYGVTAAQIQSLLPGNDSFVKLPASSYFDDKTGANIKNISGAVTSYALADGKDYTIASAFTPSVGATYDRSYTADIVNTICLPFVIDNTSGDLGTFYTLDETQSGKDAVKFTTVEITEANKPYLFIPSKTGALTLAAGTAFSAAGAQPTTVGDFSLVGVQSAQKICSDDNNAVYGFSTDGKLIKITEETNIRGMRAYLKVNVTGANPARQLRLLFDRNDATAIKNVDSEKNDNEGCYNLNGQRIASPSKGLYIVNGKKVIMK